MKITLAVALAWALLTLSPSLALAQGADGLAQRIPLSKAKRGGGTARGEVRRLSLPARAAGAGSGTRFVARIQGLSVERREAALLRELELGNVPDFLRDLRRVIQSGRGQDGLQHTVAIWVTPDYLAVGGEDDFVRMPMTPRAAQRIADRVGCLLPTRRIVDAIYRQARTKLAPSPLPPGPDMVRPAAFLAHHQRIERQLTESGARRGELIAGHKKDVVISSRLQARPDRVAIYGWHRLDGRPIQPLSTVHVNTYADYSHGIRLVHETALVDGRSMPLAEVLGDPVLWPLVSDEGPLSSARIP